jgi:methyl-accepting chemotaxis protein
MTVRLRFIVFFIAGVVAALVCTSIFFVTGAVGFVAESPNFYLAISLATLLLLFLVIVVVMLVKAFDRPVKDLLKGIEKISSGSLSPEFPEEAPAEFGLINDALITMCGQMRMVLGQLNTLSGHVVETTNGAGNSFQEVQQGSEIQSKTAERTYTAVEQLGEGLTDVSQTIDNLARNMGQSASRVSKMDVAIGHVTETLSRLNSNIDQASQTTTEGDASARSLSKEIGGLSSSVMLTQGALNEMLEVADRAQSDAGNAADVIGHLESETERIGAAIEDVIRGSDAAYASNERILEVTATLASRVERMDDVIEVIHNLAERTKLLSINASIIASEAGEHGRAFAVVAREVKDLAQSTTGAISEISHVVAGLKSGFGQTVETIQHGQTDVRQGVRLARNAVELLQSIPEQVEKAATWNKEIVKRTARQVEKGAQIKDIINKVDSTLEQVNQVLTGQVARNDRILALFQNISTTSDQVLASIREHANASRDASSTVDSVSNDFRGVAEQVRGQLMHFNNIFTLSQDVLSITDSNRQMTEDLSTLISDLNRYALYLGEDFRKLGGDEAKALARQ